MKAPAKKLILALAAPVIFMLFLEGVLALGGWVQPLRLLQQTDHDGTRYWVTNPLYGRSVFPHLGAPMPSQIWLPVEKPAGVKRVVLIGESAAQGFPNSDFSLARILEAAWELAHPDQPLQVVNLTMTGVNSHYLRRFVKEALRLDPDHIILYFGNNEYIGPYGPAAVIRNYQRSRTWIRFSQMVRATRVGQGLERMGRWFGRASDGRIPVWQGLGGFVEAPLDPADPRLASVSRNLERNVKEMVRSAAARRVPVLIAVPAVNLNDWPPLASAEATIEDDVVALNAWRAGQPNSITSAIQAYRLAYELALNENWKDAWPLFRLACDLDLYRFRADSAVREVFYRVAESHQVPLVDTDRYLHEDQTEFVSDGTYFLEHVHFTFAGRVKVVEPLMQFLERHWGVVTDAAHSTWLDPTRLGERLLFTDRLAAEMWLDVGGFYEFPTFRQQPAAEQRMQFIADQAQQLRAWSMLPERYAVIEAQANRLMEKYPADARIPIVWGQHQVAYGRGPLALVNLRKGLSLMPHHHNALFNVMSLSTAEGHWAAAEDAHRRLRSWAPDLPAANSQAGRLYAAQGRYSEALPYFRRAVAVRPNSASAHFQLAMCLDALGRPHDAVEGLRVCLKLDPRNPLYASNLAWIWLTKTEVDADVLAEAQKLAEMATAAAPEAHRFQGVLAVAYAVAGESEKALNTAETAVTLARQHGDLGAAAQLQSELARHGIELGP